MDISFNERKAIGQMISALSNRGWQQKETLTFFSDYHLPMNCSELPLYTYYQLLRELPLSVKRDIIQRVFKAWVTLYNCDRFAIYQAFTTLVYLKICSGVEFFFMNSLCSLLDYFGSNGIKGVAFDGSHYELLFERTDEKISFHLNENSDNLLITVSGCLLNEKTQFNTRPTQEQKDSLLACIAELPLRKTMRWIYANSNVEYEYKNDAGKGYVQIALTDIEYSDNNGVF